MVMRCLGSANFFCTRWKTDSTIRQKSALLISNGNFCDPQSARFQRLSASIGRFSAAAATIHYLFSGGKIPSAPMAQNPSAMLGGRRFASGRSASAKAPNGRRSSASTSGPFRSAVTHLRLNTTHPPVRRQEPPSAAPSSRRPARPRGTANNPRLVWAIVEAARL